MSELERETHDTDCGEFDIRHAIIRRMDPILVEQRLALALQAAALGTWTWDMESGITVWDERLEELHGLAPGTFGGTFDDWAAALHPDDRAECFARVEHALADPGPYLLSHRTTWADGSVHWLECRGTVTIDAEGNPTGTTGVAMDVTERAERDHDMARQLASEHQMVLTLQHALLPARIPQVPGVEVAARYRAATGDAVIGGDWYAMVPLSGDRMGVAIGDVAGHGLAAVADMADAAVQPALVGAGQRDARPVMHGLDEVVRTFAPETMITALYGVLDPARGSWTYVNAGHIPPVVIAPDGTATLLDASPGPPLGFGAAYTPSEVPLAPGSVVVLCTDGLIERRRESIELGLARLVAACAQSTGDAARRCDELLDSLVLEEHGDDIAVVVLTLAGP